MSRHITDVLDITRVATVQANVVGESFETPIVAVPPCISRACRIGCAGRLKLRLRCCRHLVAFKVHAVIAVVPLVFLVRD